MHDRISVDGICFPGATFRQQAGYWRELGAHRVSLIGPSIVDEGLPAVQAALGTGDYKVETIPHVFLTRRTLERNEESWRDGREDLNRMVDNAKALGARSVYLITGGRGKLSWEDAAACFCEAIAPCVAYAKTAGILLSIEPAPPLYTNVHLAHSLRDTVILAEMAGIGVCYDFFSGWAEAGLHEMIKRAIPRCSLVQVCDYVGGDKSLPGRAVPGDGDVPVKRLIGWLLDAGYKGVFDLELIGPRIDKEGHVAAVKRAADNVGEILHSLGA